MIARYSRPEMSRIWSEEGKLARWLEVELAALDGWAEVGAIPAATSRRSATAPSPRRAARVAEIELTTDHDLAAFVDAVAEQLGPEGRWVHYGLTSSDVVDTALALQIRDAGALARSPGSTARSPPSSRAPRSIAGPICIGRSHGIHAEPTTFGWKLAGWAFELDRARARLAARARVEPRRPAVGNRRHVRGASTRRWSGSPASGSGSSPIPSRPR